MEYERIYKKPLKQVALEIRNRKILYLLFGVLFTFLVIIFRLFYLQINQTNIFCKLGERNFLRTEVINPQRGNVLDCNGNLLATNRPAFDLYWYGSGCFNLLQEQNEIISKIKGILDQDVIDTFMQRKIERAERFSRQLLIKKDMSSEELGKISEQCCESTNLFIDRHFRRVYPYGSLASHVLGYLSSAEQYVVEGRYGLERLFEDNLRGEHGYVRHVINSTGKKLFQRDLKQARNGIDITLTLDLTMQRIAENLFESDQAGSFIVMDPEDGSIKVLVSHPSFDPNLFLNPISEQDWNDKFSMNCPFLNRAVHALYPPASIFKLITFVAGLEEGVIAADTGFCCKGYTLFCGRKYYCQRRWGHGNISAKKSLSVSCNIPCYEVAQKISIDQLAAYAMRFGLGQSTNFLFCDKAGLVPTSCWKQAYRGERWWNGETLSASIGQSFLLVTPLQIVRMVASICSGYLVKPRILIDEEVDRYPLYVAEETRNFLIEVMKEVVVRGTARRLNAFSDFSVYAKTGTAQTVSLKKQKKEAKSQREHAWFASCFSYKNEKPLAMVIVVENVGSSRPALHIAEKFLEEYQKVLKET